MQKGKILALIVLFGAICAMGYANVKLYQAQQLYMEGNASYDDLAARIRWMPPRTSPTTPSAEKSEKSETTGTAPENGGKAKDPYPEHSFGIPPLEINFPALRKVNQDASAWLYSPNTVIDYPVMAASDYQYYLDHLPDGARNANGSLFIDYNNAPDFGDPLTIVYGHHMKSGAMFGSLKGYKSQSYFEQHPRMYLYTPRGNYRIDLMYGFVIGAELWREKSFMYSENLDALMLYGARNSTFISDVRRGEGDRIVALSTCSYEFNEARYVLLGLLVEES